MGNGTYVQSLGMIRKTLVVMLAALFLATGVIYALSYVHAFAVCVDIDRDPGRTLTLAAEAGDLKCTFINRRTYSRSLSRSEQRKLPGRAVEDHRQHDHFAGLDFRRYDAGRLVKNGEGFLTISANY